ncbi:type I glyceraldehyde-3-phosphate dehydrogenase [Gammaproteobacteria bacterium 50_400_T64]|nr:type I glyceraldehyde-3-phosphate dehydrogenase [Gammaproteobacteria bacterium 50_400_T64]
MKIAINGYGRIGRNIVRAIFENGLDKKIEIVAINDLTPPGVCAHLTQFDTTHGRFDAEVSFTDQSLTINNQTIKWYQHTKPGEIPWGDHDIDIVLECAGKFKTHLALEQHLQAGAPKVLVAHPVADADYTVVYGVNHAGLSASHRIVSNASCTTNCLAPVAKVLHEEVGIESGFMTTIHAYTNDQNLIDKAHSDLYRARAAAMSMIPTKTGAAAAVGKVLPELAGKIDGLAVRVPTINVSLVDCVFNTSRSTSVEEINQLMQKASAEMPAGVLACNELPLVSIDFNHHPASSIFDLTQTRVNDSMIKVMAWYDNEWGFSNRMLDVAALMVAAK